MQVKTQRKKFEVATLLEHVQGRLSSPQCALQGECALPAQIALVWGLGRAPAAPGTVATFVAGIPCAYVQSLFPLKLALFFLIAAILIACYASEWTSKAMNRPDPGDVVVDELVGYLVTMIGLPCTAGSMLLGALAFRLFDIWKPWPVGFIDRNLHGGLGIVMDDVAAGVLAHACVWLVLQVL